MRAFVFAAMAAVLPLQTLVAGDVPAKYRRAYSDLDKALRRIERQVDLYEKARVTENGEPAFYIELLCASPNRGSVILEPRVRKGVTFNLDRAVQLGITGISFDI